MPEPTNLQKIATHVADTLYGTPINGAYLWRNTRMAKLTSEVRELEESIKATDLHISAIKDELADCLFILNHIASAESWTLDELLHQATEKNLKRILNPEYGRTKPPHIETNPQ